MNSPFLKIKDITRKTFQAKNDTLKYYCLLKKALSPGRFYALGLKTTHQKTV